MNQCFADNRLGRCGKPAGKGRWVILWLFCLVFMLSGCGVSGGDQITKMDKKYLAEKETEQNREKDRASSRPESMEDASKDDSSKDDGQTKAPGGERDSRKSSSPVPGTPSKVPGSPKKSRASNSKDESKKNSVKSNTSSKNSKKDASSSKDQANQKKKEDATKKKDSSQEEKDDAQKKDSGDDGEKRDSGGISCYLSIDCKTVLSHLSKLKESKKEYVPKNGVIINQMKVTVKPGTSVYDVLYQVCRDREIHLEASYTPMYKSYYVEGIHQLYEFDCGDLSGWSYMVNGEQPSLGCSKYLVKDGDEIAWRYTCERGKDL